MNRLETSTTPEQLTPDRSVRLRITRKIMRLLGDLVFMKTTLKVTVTGLEKVPRTGPTIVVFNHANSVDWIVVICSIRFRDMVPIGKQELYNNPITWLGFWGWGMIPVKRGQVDRTALRRSIEVIESQDMLMVSPEGHRQREGLRDPKEGVIMLAARTRALIVPVGVSGTEKILHNLIRLRRTPAICRIGAPFRIKEDVTRKQYSLAAHELMYRIAPLLEPNLRGDYADLSKATTETIEITEIPASAGREAAPSPPLASTDRP